MQCDVKSNEMAPHTHSNAAARFHGLCRCTGEAEGAKKVDVPLEPPVAQEPVTILSENQPGADVLIHNVTLLTADDSQPAVKNGWIRLSNGRIQGLGSGQPPESTSDERRIDGRGGFVTPGLIDTHSHLGVYPTPHVWAHADGNEMTNPIRAGVRAREAFGLKILVSSARSAE